VLNHATYHTQQRYNQYTMKSVHKSLLAFVIITLSLLSCETSKQKPEDKASSLQEEMNFSSFDQYFNNLENFSGNVLVAVNGKSIYEKSYGYANIELNVKNTSKTKFRIGSITKQFTAMAVMILQEQGKLNVTDKLSNHIPNVPEIWKEITIHQLLTHTSGIMHSWALEGFEENMMLYTPIEDIIDKFKDQPLVGDPGEKFQYSGTGYFILSSLIEKVSGKSYEDFLIDEIFSKIEMTNSGSDVPRKIIENRASGYITDSTGMNNSTYIYMPILTGGGNLYSTTEDFLKWDQSLYNNALITKESKEKMFKPELNSYAYGWRVIKRDTLYVTTHGGSVPGFLTKIWRFPNDKLLVVILSNNKRSENPETGREFVNLVREELDKTGYNNK
jgi:CubicO group peptidase (beta-lactamase class C family)